VSGGLRRFEAEERQLAWLRERIAEAEVDVHAGRVYEDSDEFWQELNREVDEALIRGDQPSPHVCP
jgi:hypothetical protein